MTHFRTHFLLQRNFKVFGSKVTRSPCAQQGLPTKASMRLCAAKYRGLKLLSQFVIKTPIHSLRLASLQIILFHLKLNTPTTPTSHTYLKKWYKQRNMAKTQLNFIFYFAKQGNPNSTKPTKPVIFSTKPVNYNTHLLLSIIHT